jgi:hypothetical protein
MDEPIGFWVRQIATDGAVIAVRAVPGQETTRSTNASVSESGGRSAEDRKLPVAAEAA